MPTYGVVRVYEKTKCWVPGKAGPVPIVNTLLRRRMAEIKKVPKKLRDGPTILVDTQILAWRKMMRREGIKLGRGMRYSEKINKAWRENHAEVMAERDKPTKKKWF